MVHRLSGLHKHSQSLLSALIVGALCTPVAYSDTAKVTSQKPSLASPGFNTVRDLQVGDSLSGLTVTNNTGAGIPVTGLQLGIVYYNADSGSPANCSSDSHYDPGDTQSINLFTPFTINASHTAQVGQNYLYNIMITAVSVVYTLGRGAWNGDVTGLNCPQVRVTNSQPAGFGTTLKTIGFNGPDINLTCTNSNQTCTVSPAVEITIS